MWTAGSTISVQVINDIGMSIGQGVWSGWVALTSFLWGAFGHHFFPVFTTVTMRSQSGALVGLALLLTGIVLLAGVGGAADKVRGFRIPSSLAVRLIVCHPTVFVVAQAEKKEEQSNAHERERLLRPDGLDARGLTHAPINDSTAAGQVPSAAVFIRGLLLAVMVGLCGGSTLVPIKFSPVRSAPPYSSLDKPA
eukprot:COSAG02_NODE_4735_length_5038_cov_116.051427_4_plen_194_part_00